MAVAAALLAMRFVAGPYRFALVAVNSPVNAGAAVTVSFVLLALIAARNPAAPLPEPRTAWVDLTILIAVTAVAFRPNLRSPFVYDDYRHIVEASHTTWRILADAFKRVPGGVLLEQPYAKDDSQTVTHVLGAAQVVRFAQVVIGG